MSDQSRWRLHACIIGEVIKMRVFSTGGMVFIGTLLTDELLATGYEVTVPDRSIVEEISV